MTAVLACDSDRLLSAECRASSQGRACRVYDRLLALVSSYVDGVGELFPPSVVKGDICMFGVSVVLL